MAELCLIAAIFGGLLLFLGALGAALERRKSKREKVPWTPARRKEVVGGPDASGPAELEQDRRAS